MKYIKYVLLAVVVALTTACSGESNEPCYVNNEVTWTTGVSFMMLRNECNAVHTGTYRKGKLYSITETAGEHGDTSIVFDVDTETLEYVNFYGGAYSHSVYWSENYQCYVEAIQETEDDAVYEDIYCDGDEEYEYVVSTWDYSLWNSKINLALGMEK